MSLWNPARRNNGVHCDKKTITRAVIGANYGATKYFLSNACKRDSTYGCTNFSKNTKFL